MENMDKVEVALFFSLYHSCEGALLALEISGLSKASLNFSWNWVSVM